MSKFFKTGNSFVQTPSEFEESVSELPLGTYSITNTPIGFKLERIKDFTMPSNIYGDVTSRRDKIINTYRYRDNSTGVLLTGEKGSGKTLLAKYICTTLTDHLILVINQPLFGVAFNNLIQSIEQPTIVVFDEFEKVYSEQELQESLLTLFDGTSSSKKLFLLTCNDACRLAEPLLNRPGRIYYRFNYTGVDYKFVSEYCDHNLQFEKEKNKEVLIKLAAIYNLNFDLLQSLVEEINRYHISIREASKDLNFNFSSQLKAYKARILEYKTHDLLYETTTHAEPLRIVTSSEDEKNYNVLETPRFRSPNKKKVYNGTAVLATELVKADFELDKFIFEVKEVEVYEEGQEVREETLIVELTSKATTYYPSFL